MEPRKQKQTRKTRCSLMEYRFVGIWAWTSRQSSWGTLNCAAKALSVPTQGSMNPSIFGFVYLNIPPLEGGSPSGGTVNMYMGRRERSMVRRSLSEGSP